MKLQWGHANELKILCIHKVSNLNSVIQSQDNVLFSNLKIIIKTEEFQELIKKVFMKNIKSKNWSLYKNWTSSNLRACVVRNVSI